MDKNKEFIHKTTEKRIQEMEKIPLIYGRVTNEASKNYKEKRKEIEFAVFSKEDKGLLLEKNEKEQRMIIKKF